MKSVTKRIYLIDFSLAVLGYTLFVLFDILNKKLIGSYHVSQIIFVNSISALLPIFLFTQARNGWVKLKKVNYWGTKVEDITVTKNILQEMGQLTLKIMIKSTESLHLRYFLIFMAQNCKSLLLF